MVLCPQCENYELFWFKTKTQTFFKRFSLYSFASIWTSHQYLFSVTVFPKDVLYILHVKTVMYSLNMHSTWNAAISSYSCNHPIVSLNCFFLFYMSVFHCHMFMQTVKHTRRFLAMCKCVGETWITHNKLSRSQKQRHNNWRTVVIATGNPLHTSFSRLIVILWV